MSMIAKNRTKSTWTPLSNEETNNKIFEERRALVGKWYDKWNDEQRRRLLEDLVKKSKNKQCDYAHELIKAKVPAVHKDFTRMLPRVITLYLMSFLDPRSLCRCARVCWYWKYLSELDQLWMPKNLRLGWFLSFTPSPFENGVWKRNYLEHIKSLQVLRPTEPAAIELEKLNLQSIRKGDKNRTKKTHSQPWRGSDPVPKDTWRYNILENDDIVENVNQMRKKKTYPADDNLKTAKSKLNTHQSMSLTRRSQSLSKLHSSVTSMTSPDRPKWAVHTTGAPFMNRNSTLHNGVASTATRPKSQTPKTPKSFRPIRSERDPPTTELFPTNPWQILDGNPSDED